MQFLLQTTTRHSTSFALYHTWENALAAAVAFVGEHQEYDSCSFPRDSWAGDDYNFRTWRNTSFGQRKAEVSLIEFLD